MPIQQTIDFIINVLKNIPEDWLKLTTHRLDIYNEKLAKTAFLEDFNSLFENNITNTKALANLPTAYDYIRLGHPLSCVLEWFVAKTQQLPNENVIAFDSKTMPILAILRENLLSNTKTRILHTTALPANFDEKTLKNVYNFNFEIVKVKQGEAIPAFNGSTIYIQEKEHVTNFKLTNNIDFYLNTNTTLGSVLLINETKNTKYVAAIQHVRRRESIAITPENCLLALQNLVSGVKNKLDTDALEQNKKSVNNLLQQITGTTTKPLVASSGLSMQYAIMMGLIADAQQKHPKKAIKFVVPPNCYGGTNDQARRVAACINNVAIVDLPVDGENDMVNSLETVLDKIANEDAIAYIIAEIPTNPRVEVPNLEDLKTVLAKERVTKTGAKAIGAVFILDQTFCPNYLFLGKNKILSTVKAIAYASGSKFPSGGKCTAGYCVSNENASYLMQNIAKHLAICNNEATTFQYEVLAAQLPSMNKRIADAYLNTRDFVNYIKAVLPKAKINFVSEELAKQGFMPSVFSLDLPTKGNSEAEKETYKRALNLKLINLMITRIPNESKFCVSYGQLKGCYWTIPATSTQGTTKEGDKDYIVRTSLSAKLDLELHKKVFLEFVESM